MSIKCRWVVFNLFKHILDDWNDTQAGHREAYIASTLLQILHDTLMLEARC